MNIGVSPDGSTYNLSIYFMYVRDALVNKMNRGFLIMYLWSIVCGAIIYYITFNSLTNVISENG